MGKALRHGNPIKPAEEGRIIVDGPTQMPVKNGMLGALYGVNLHVSRWNGSFEEGPWQAGGWTTYFRVPSVTPSFSKALTLSSNVAASILPARRS